MKMTLTTSDISRALLNDDNANWTWEGAQALAEYLEECEEASGEEMELDAVAIRCDYSEHESLVDWATNYFRDGIQDSSLGLETGDEGEVTADEDEIDDAIREYIQDHGTLIEFDGGIIVSSF